MSSLERNVENPSNPLKKAPEVLMLIFLREISIDVRGVKSSFSVFSYFFAVFGDTRSLFCLLPSLTVFHRHNRFFQPLCIKFHYTVFSFYSIFLYYTIFWLRAVAITLALVIVEVAVHQVVVGVIRDILGAILGARHALLPSKQDTTAHGGTLIQI